MTSSVPLSPVPVDDTLGPALGRLTEAHHDHHQEEGDPELGDITVTIYDY